MIGYFTNAICVGKVFAFSIRNQKIICVILFILNNTQLVKKLVFEDFFDFHQFTFVLAINNPHQNNK